MRSSIHRRVAANGSVVSSRLLRDILARGSVLQLNYSRNDLLDKDLVLIRVFEFICYDMYNVNNIFYIYMVCCLLPSAYRRVLVCSKSLLFHGTCLGTID